MDDENQPMKTKNTDNITEAEGETNNVAEVEMETNNITEIGKETNNLTEADEETSGEYIEMAEVKDKGEE